MSCSPVRNSIEGTSIRACLDGFSIRRRDNSARSSPSPRSESIWESAALEFPVGAHKMARTRVLETRTTFPEHSEDAEHLCGGGPFVEALWRSFDQSKGISYPLRSTTTSAGTASRLSICSLHSLPLRIDRGPAGHALLVFLCERATWVRNEAREDCRYVF